MRIVTTLLFLLAALAVQASPDATSNCLVRIDQLVEVLNGFAQSASNDTAYADCIAERLTKIKGLASIAHTFADAASHLADTNSTAAEGNRAMVQSACTRAEKLAVDAADCRTTGPTNSLSPAVPTASSRPAPAPVAVPVTNHPAPLPPLGDNATCLTQVKLAALLIQAMDLEVKPTTEMAIQLLTKQSIEPLGGWQAERCVTLGDLCVVVAQVLHLKVAGPDDPANYLQAVRNDGLPVDALPVHRLSDVLYESAVRAFLARGYAAPFPSSRRLQLD